MSREAPRPNVRAEGELRPEEGRWSAHHKHKEGRVVRRGAIGRRRDTEGVFLALEALRACAHRVPLQGVQHLLHPWSLRPILADAVHCGARAKR